MFLETWLRERLTLIFNTNRVRLGPKHGLQEFPHLQPLIYKLQCPNFKKQPQKTQKPGHLKHNTTVTWLPNDQWSLTAGRWPWVKIELESRQTLNRHCWTGVDAWIKSQAQWPKAILIIASCTFRKPKTKFILASATFWEATWMASSWKERGGVGGNSSKGSCVTDEGLFNLRQRSLLRSWGWNQLLLSFEDALLGHIPQVVHIMTWFMLTFLIYDFHAGA